MAVWKGKNKLMLASLILLGVFVYLGVMLVLLSLGSGEWLVVSSPEKMRFKRPWPLRASAGMLGFLLFSGAGLGATVFAPAFGPWFAWGCFVPLCLLLGGLFFCFSGPQEICISLNTRRCFQMTGWMFFPQENVFSLSETSHLRVFRGGSGCYVVLCLDGIEDQKFMLGKTSRLSTALSYAEKVATALRLPIREKTPEEMSIR